MNHFQYLQLISEHCMKKIQSIKTEQHQVEQRIEDVFIVLDDAIHKLSQMQHPTSTGIAVGVHFYLKALESI